MHLILWAIALFASLRERYFSFSVLLYYSTIVQFFMFFWHCPKRTKNARLPEWLRPASHPRADYSDTLDILYRKNTPTSALQVPLLKASGLLFTRTRADTAGAVFIALNQKQTCRPTGDKQGALPSSSYWYRTFSPYAGLSRPA